MSSTEESQFDIEELFFSRTDLKGIIRAGNSVFRRISGYDWPDLINRPHNLIRHEDMPRGVFFLFWKTLHSGSPIGAYVKNKSKDGRYYWVFGLALPIPDGYISIRLKPSSPIFGIVKAEYQKLLQIEQNKSLSPKDSCEALEKVIGSLGFKDYSAFMVKALMEELTSRQKLLGRPEIAALKNFNEIMKWANALKDKAKEIAAAFERSTLVPLNLTIQSNKLEKDGAPIAVVADKYAEMASEIQTEFAQFENAITLAQRAIESCQYFLCAQALQVEVVEVFKSESDPGPNDIKEEMAHLNRISEQGRQSSLAALNEIMVEFDKFKSTCERLKTISTGLEIVRLTGKIEVARLNRDQKQLDHLILELLKFRTYLNEAIREVSSFGANIQTLTGEVVGQLNQQKPI